MKCSLHPTHFDLTSIALPLFIMIKSTLAPLLVLEQARQHYLAHFIFKYLYTFLGISADIISASPIPLQHLEGASWSVGNVLCPQGRLECQGVSTCKCSPQPVAKD